MSIFSDGFICPECGTEMIIDKTTTVIFDGNLGAVSETTYKCPDGSCLSNQPYPYQILVKGMRRFSDYLSSF